MKLLHRNYEILSLRWTCRCAAEIPEQIGVHVSVQVQLLFSSFSLESYCVYAQKLPRNIEDLTNEELVWVK